MRTKLLLILLFIGSLAFGQTYTLTRTYNSGDIPASDSVNDHSCHRQMTLTMPTGNSWIIKQVDVSYTYWVNRPQGDLLNRQVPRVTCLNTGRWFTQGAAGFNAQAAINKNDSNLIIDNTVVSSGTAFEFDFSLTRAFVSSTCNTYHTKVLNNTWTVTITYETATRPIIYVNHTATGNNDGTSWTDAYTELSTAMANHHFAAFWVAQGIYKPITSSTNPREAAFRLYYGDHIYGGFSGNGTETLVTDRDPINYLTILSGDLNGDDNAIITDIETTRQDNSYHVVRAIGSAQEMLIDGVTISGGNANGALSNACNSGQNDRRRGAAINVQATNGNRVYLTVNNCILEKNTATDTAVYSALNGCGHNNIIADTDFTNCTIRNNYSDTNGAFFFSGATQHTQYGRGSLVNCEFYDNVSANGPSTLYVINSSGGSSSGTDVDIINSTFSNNTGLNGYVMRFTKAASTIVRNSIIWNNASTTPLNITTGSPAFNNNIIEGYQTTDPLFIDGVNNDFNLQATSPAIDAGRNDFIPANITTDITGANRIISSNVDMGAYEYSCASCSILNTSVVGSGSIAPAGGFYTATDVVNLTATPDAGWIFSGWSGDVTGYTNPVSVTMATSKTITATFIETPIFVDIDATGNNDGSSWANAYNDLKTAITNATAGDELWVAKGTYIPSGTGRTAAFSVNKPLKIYGGFAGFEGAITQRNVSQNTTILSGDINGNDNPVITDENDTTRQDNAYHVFKVRGNFANGGFLDGFTITGGNSNGSTSTSGSQSSQYSNSVGAAIYGNPVGANYSVFWKFTNCTIEKNTSSNRGAVSATFNPSGASGTGSTIDYENCIVRDNYSRLYENLFYSGSQSYYVKNYGSITNCLFYNNKTDGANRGAVLLMNSGGSNAFPACVVNVLNSTFVHNISPTNKAIKLSMTNAGGSIRNTIVYDNGTSTQPIEISGSLPSTANNIIEGGQLGGTNVDPLFVDAANNDYRLSSGSPAIDAGNNSLFPNPTNDLFGNVRIFNTSIDIGCYEFNTTPTHNLSTNAVGNGTVSPSGTSVYNENTVVNITAIPAAGWQFDSWSGASTSTNANINITMDTDKSVTATFIQSQYDLTIIATNGAATPDIGTLNNGVYTYLSNTSVQITATATQSTHQFDHFILTDSNGSTNSNTNPLTISMTSDITVEAVYTLVSRVYVDNMATGNNDGTTWIDAYTNLNTAIANHTDFSIDIWVKEGTYTPTNSGTARKSSYLLNKPVKIYGSFDGTEFSISDRDTYAHPTILSGDVNNDDNVVITDETDASRQDNLYHVIKVKGSFNAGGIMNGFTITGGNANGSVSNSCSTAQNLQFNDGLGAAIYANPDGGSHTVFMKFQNCIIEKNTANHSGAIMTSFGPCGAQATRSTINFESCILRDNYSKRYENIMYAGSQSYNNRRYGSLINCLAYNNKTDGANRASVLLLSSGGSGNYAACDVDIINSTFTNNTAPNNYAVKMAMTNAGGSMYNTIIYGNGSTAPILLTGQAVSRANNLVEGGIFGSITSDPLFQNSANNDYKLQSGSPAIDAGANSYITATEDLLGNVRIYNTTVDIGCLEYNPNVTATVNNFETVLDFTIYPNPTTNILNIKMDDDLERITVYNVQGQKVLENNTKSTNVSKLTSGFYLIKILSSEGKTATKRFIKK